MGYNIIGDRIIYFTFWKENYVFIKKAALPLRNVVRVNMYRNFYLV